MRDQIGGYCYWCKISRKIRDTICLKSHFYGGNESLQTELPFKKWVGKTIFSQYFTMFLQFFFSKMNIMSKNDIFK